MLCSKLWCSELMGTAVVGRAGKVPASIKVTSGPILWDAQSEILMGQMHFLVWDETVLLAISHSMKIIVVRMQRFTPRQEKMLNIIY